MKLFIIGCGALNWDIFFKVDKYEDLDLPLLKVEAGREYILEREAFLKLYRLLKERAELVFEGGGGSSANSIYCLAKLGIETAFLGAVGEDEFGEKVLWELRKGQVNTEFIKRGGTTSLALILLDGKQDRAIIVSPGTSEEHLSLERKHLQPSALYHLSSFASEAGKSFQKNLLQALHHKISFDPGEIYTSLGKTFLESFLKKTKYLFITERELLLSGYSSEELLRKGISFLFLKMGKRGAQVVTKEKIFRSSVIPASRIVDNTGAGDYFNAGVLAGLSLKLSIEKAFVLGLTMASLSLRGYGRQGLPSKEEFKKILSKVK